MRYVIDLLNVRRLKDKIVFVDVANKVHSQIELIFPRDSPRYAGLWASRDPNSQSIHLFNGHCEPDIRRWIFTGSDVPFGRANRIDQASKIEMPVETLSSCERIARGIVQVASKGDAVLVPAITVLFCRDLPRLPWPKATLTWAL